MFLIWLGKSELANSNKNSRVDNKVKRSANIYRDVSEEKGLLPAEIKAKLT